MHAWTLESSCRSHSSLFTTIRMLQIWCKLHLFLRDTVSSRRVARDDPHPFLSREKCLKRHHLRAVRSTAPQASTLKSMITEACAQGGRLQDEGRHGPDVLQHVIRFLGRGLSKAAPVAASRQASGRQAGFTQACRRQASPCSTPGKRKLITCCKTSGPCRPSSCRRPP